MSDRIASPRAADLVIAQALTVLALSPGLDGRDETFLLELIREALPETGNIHPYASPLIAAARARISATTSIDHARAGVDIRRALRAWHRWRLGEAHAILGKAS